jgi:hypothetical protein
MRVQPKELPERRLPRHKTMEKIGVDEGFVKGVEEEEVSPSPHPRPPGASTAEPSRMVSARASESPHTKTQTSRLKLLW